MTLNPRVTVLMSLEKRRSLADVTFLYTVLNGNIDIDISKIIDFHSEADHFLLRAKDSLTLKKKYARTNVLKYRFFHRITDQWNQLPLDTRVSDNVNIFQSRVRKFFSDFVSSFYISVCSKTIILLCFYIFLGDLFFIWGQESFTVHPLVFNS